jgi:hypothetical protein
MSNDELLLNKNLLNKIEFFNENKDKDKYKYKNKDDDNDNDNDIYKNLFNTRDEERNLIKRDIIY